MMRQLELRTRILAPTRVVRLVLERTEEDLSLSLWMRSNKDGEEQQLRFGGVSQLRFRGETTDLTNIVAIQIEDIASLGWENVRFRVKDYEEEFFSLFCERIDEKL